VPEIVPFRLTPQMVNAFGINGCDGDFRKVCETMVRIMRSNRGLLLNVLEAFVHDPLVEWAKKKHPQPACVACARACGRDACVYWLSTAGLSAAPVNRVGERGSFA
jgi:phosphatidylinositol kinase/protein kinase (PI-3  family)